MFLRISKLKSQNQIQKLPQIRETMATSTAAADWDPSSSSDEESPLSSLLTFDKERHVAFLEMMYQMLPYHYQSQEINHLTLAYFVISGLGILGSLDRVSSFCLIIFKTCNTIAILKIIWVAFGYFVASLIFFLPPNILI